jgi:A/G-specific adenine glycosylase
MSPFPPSPELLCPLPCWFSAHGRTLPWRAENLDQPHPDPYAVLVSELMLQQTQVATVIPYFLRWMARFPDPGSLSGATDEEVHKLWEGLGYYRRARFLKQAASAIAAEGWPGDLGSLPGLGPYTAAAVAAIAFQRPEPALDGNAFRVLARLLGLRDDPRGHGGELREWLRPALVALGPSRLTQALMELGATVCTPRADCVRCPLADACLAHRLEATDRIPPPLPRARVKALELWLVAIEAEQHWLLLQPAAKGLLAGLWRWPALEPALRTTARAAEALAPYEDLETRRWQGWSQLYSHRKEHVLPLAIRLPRRFVPAPGCAWIPQAGLAALPLGRRDQRLRELLQQEGGPNGQEAPVRDLLRRIEAGEA